MDVADIEELAEHELARVPEWIWDGETLPVPVEHIADSHFGLHVRAMEDLRSAPGLGTRLPERDLSGVLLPALGEIWVNAAEARAWPPRRRFTIGHELGHWCLHRTESTVWCRSHSVDPPNGQTGSRRASLPPEEREANEFAAAILMPGALVRSRYERLRREDPDSSFQQLCEIFETSGAAMGRRLRRVV